MRPLLWLGAAAALETAQAGRSLVEDGAAQTRSSGLRDDDAGVHAWRHAQVPFAFLPYHATIPQMMLATVVELAGLVGVGSLVWYVALKDRRRGFWRGETPAPGGDFKPVTLLGRGDVCSCGLGREDMTCLGFCEVLCCFPCVWGQTVLRAGVVSPLAVGLCAAHLLALFCVGLTVVLYSDIGYGRDLTALGKIDAAIGGVMGVVFMWVLTLPLTLLAATARQRMREQLMGGAAEREEHMHMDYGLWVGLPCAAHAMVAQEALYVELVDLEAQKRAGAKEGPPSQEKMN